MKLNTQACSDTCLTTRNVLLSMCLLLPCGLATSQDIEAVKATMLKNLAKIENYSAGVIQGKWVFRGLMENAGRFEFRGDKRWLEYEQHMLDQPLEQQITRRNAAREVKGTQGSPHTFEFDGKKLYEFDPFNLAFSVKSMNRMPSIFSNLPLHPTHWLHMHPYDSPLSEICREVRR